MKPTFTLKSLATLLPLLFAPAIHAAECYAQSGSQRCVSWEDIWQFREWYCTQEWYNAGADKWYNGSNGFSAHIRHSGTIPTQQLCWDSTADIINQCYGQKDGGTWTVGEFSIDINYCA